jgi:RNA polymerase sigma-70 factor (ECF subfamily)
VPNSYQTVPPISIVQFLPSPRTQRQKKMHAIYEANRRRVYSFAFWMTDSEPVAEQLTERTFVRAFSIHNQPTDEQIDNALLRELKKEASVSFEPPQLRCAPASEVSSVRHNTRRVDLECALVQLPHTERMIFCMHDGDGYDHARIARTLGISEDDSRQGLHQARLRIRELVSVMRSQKLA